MRDRREIRLDGRELGAITIGRIQHLMENGELDHTAEFWSDRRNAWCAVAGIMYDIDPLRVEQMRGAGVERVRIVGTPEDCPACKELAGTCHGIDELTDLPPPDCVCLPWCRLNVVAVEPVVGAVRSEKSQPQATAAL